ncbi:MFS general substrate transporter [Dipodascopsis tothii]|uniref:MFS general substrate transporter n=1 Tax=Dipodascopsis tothii TaxID=44089 RepID=UPI0034CEB0BE
MTDSSASTEEKQIGLSAENLAATAPNAMEDVPIDPVPTEKPAADGPVILHPPDQGLRAWGTVVGAFAGLFVSFGYVNVVGVFLEYYSTNQLKDYSSSDVAWITSVQSFLMIFGGLVFGRLHDMVGPNPLTIFGSVFILLGVFTTASCKTYAQFMLSQGICSGIGGSAMFYTAMATVSSWFVKYRGTALGISVGGSSIGGVILPVMFRRVLLVSDFGWAVRSLGFLMLFLCLVAIATLHPRIKPKGLYKVDFENDYGRPFRYVPFVVLTAGIFCMFWGLFVPIGYIPSHAVAHHFSSELADYLVSIMNAGSFLGRVSIGMLADKVGPYNCYAFASAASGLLTVALWLPATGHVPIILYAVLFGYASGATISLMPAVIASISPVHEIGTRMGAISGVGSLAALSGMPIAGALLKFDKGSYYGLAIWGGVMLFAAGAFVSTTRVLVFGSQLKKKA